MFHALTLSMLDNQYDRWWKVSSLVISYIRIIPCEIKRWKVNCFVQALSLKIRDPAFQSSLFTVHNEVAASLYFHKRVSRILSGGGGFCLGACWDTPPPGKHPPSRPPPGQTPPPPADGYCSRQYASYWNASLFLQILWVTRLQNGNKDCVFA